MTQLVKRSLPIPEVHSSNPVIGKIYIEHLFTCLLSAVLKRPKINKKRLGTAHFIKRSFQLASAVVRRRRRRLEFFSRCKMATAHNDEGGKLLNVPPKLPKSLKLVNSFFAVP